ncbi:MAG: MBL fold metallo-hydrolase, partial [Acidobacteriota bacterium]|nr:MBL fold metallo-hydrolase [Acidobacteriota bacterium]
MRLRTKDRGRAGEVSAVELAARLGTDREPCLLDVRQPEEVAAWAIPGALHVPLGELPGRLDELPTGRQVVVVCASGHRSSQAAAFLARAGFDVANLTGGMAAWGQVYDTATAELSSGHLVQVRRRAKGCLSYVVGSGDEAFVVDPSTEVELYLGIARSRGWRITRVFDTHLHADHLSGARALAGRAGASLHLSPYDSFEFDYAPLGEDERFSLSGGLEVAVTVVRTPGHTEGSVVFVVGDEAVLTGDTLFVDGVGRPDLAERAEEFARNL